LAFSQLIYGTDGKEYLTPEQLEKEIKEEIASSGGRVSITDIQVSSWASSTPAACTAQLLSYFPNVFLGFSVLISLGAAIPFSSLLLLPSS
jgi:hypothetical protein